MVHAQPIGNVFITVIRLCAAPTDTVLMDTNISIAPALSVTLYKMAVHAVKMLDRAAMIFESQHTLAVVYYMLLRHTYPRI
jgi:hypothetical protein